MSAQPATVGIVIALAVLGLPVHAANDAVQGVFNNACRTPTAALAVRCAQTPDGAGNVSGDSESSLNPSQLLSAADGVLGSGQQRSIEVRERQHRGQKDAAALRVGPFSFLVNGTGTWERRDGHPNLGRERRYDADRHGADVGFDYRVSDAVTVGGVITWEDGELEFAGERPGNNFVPAPEAGRIESRTLGATLVTTWHGEGKLHVEGALGYAGVEQDLTRRAVFQESTRTVAQTLAITTGDQDGRQYISTLNAGLDFTFGATAVDTYGGLTWLRTRLDGYTEEDPARSGLALRVEDTERDSLLGVLGVSVRHVIGRDFGVVIPQLRVEYEHEFEDDAPVVRTRFVLDNGASALQVVGEKPQQHRFNVAAGVLLVLPNGWLPFLDTQAMLGSGDTSRYRVTLGLRRELR